MSIGPPERHDFRPRQIGPLTFQQLASTDHFGKYLDIDGNAVPKSQGTSNVILGSKHASGANWMMWLVGKDEAGHDLCELENRGESNFLSWRLSVDQIDEDAGLGSVMLTPKMGSRWIIKDAGQHIDFPSVTIQSAKHDGFYLDLDRDTGKVILINKRAEGTNWCKMPSDSKQQRPRPIK